MARTEQLEVLNALDKAKTQWYHFTAIIISGMGFFTDAYDIFCITTVTKLLGRLYYYDPATGKPGSLPPNVSAAVNGVALCGTLAGQLFFGWLGDKLGRKKVYGMTLITMVGGALASGLSFGHTAKSVMTTLCFFRFWLGFGIGGDYPLSATIMSEYANKRTRGAFIAAVFAMQGFGILTGGAVSIIVATSFNKAYPRPTFEENPGLSTAPQADFVWRIILMFGAIPALQRIDTVPAFHFTVDFIVQHRIYRFFPLRSWINNLFHRISCRIRLPHMAVLARWCRRIDQLYQWRFDLQCFAYCSLLPIERHCRLCMDRIHSILTFVYVPPLCRLQKFAKWKRLYRVSGRIDSFLQPRFTHTGTSPN